MIHPKKFVKKPKEILALQFTGKNHEAVGAFVGRAAYLVDDELVIRTLEDGKNEQAKHVASAGDWIIKGIKGEFYPVKPEIFKETYDEVYVSEGSDPNDDPDYVGY